MEPSEESVLYTSGKHILILGGDLGKGRLQELKTTLQPASLRWDAGWDTRRVHHLADAIKAGSVDLVILLVRFLNHNASTTIVAAAKASSVVCVTVRNGRSASQIAAELTRTGKQ